MSLKEKLLEAESYLDEYKRRTKERLGLFETAIIYPYRGYGNDQVAILKGRVLEHEKTIHGDRGKDKGLIHNALRFLKRYESDEIPGVKIRSTFAGTTKEVVTNSDGYFEFQFEYKEKPSSGWHEAELEVVSSKYDLPIKKTAIAEIYIVGEEPEYGIISDVDDTLIESNATNLVQRIKTMVTHTAKSRPVFEGVGELYKALSKEHRNPLWFVSGSSYNLHDLLLELCHYNDIPKAPFMLRDLGLDDIQWVKQDTSEYKMKHIDHIMEMFPNLNFILIGDSGQQDPEIYQKTDQKYPDRIHAVYIRHVTDDERRAEVDKIADQLKPPLTLITKSKEAIDHAKSIGFI